MDKTARKPSMDPVQEKLRQNKATWNKDVSGLVNDLIHFKKMMNGWPSKFFKERSRITDEIPADPATIIGSLSGDFQEIVNRGNALIQEQLAYSKSRRQKQPKQMNLPFNQQAPAAGQTPPAEPSVDLSKQLSLPNVGSANQYDLIKMANKFEDKYFLETEASNPISRFITRLMNPRMGFGEGARVRRLRRTLLDACAKTYKELKRLQSEIVKSSKGSVVNSHKLMTSVWNHWSIVSRTFSMFRVIAPKPVKDFGGPIEAPSELQEEKPVESLTDPTANPESPEAELPLYKVERVKSIISDYSNYGQLFYTNIAFQELSSIIDKIKIVPKANRVDVIMNSNIENIYNNVISSLNQEHETNGKSLKEIVAQLTKKKMQPQVAPPTDVKNASSAEELLVQAQLRKWLGKTRHQLLPGSTSGSRLEIYRLIEVTKEDVDKLMDLIQKGFDEEKMTTAISQVNKEMTSLRVMLRSFYYSEKPNEVPTTFF